MFSIVSEYGILKNFSKANTERCDKFENENKHLKAENKHLKAENNDLKNKLEKSMAKNAIKDNCQVHNFLGSVSS